VSEVRELGGGAPLTPFMRAAVAADYSHPCVNGGDSGLGDINSDLTLYLHRDLEGEWIGLLAVKHHATAGVAIDEFWLHDQGGPIGRWHNPFEPQHRQVQLIDEDVDRRTGFASLT
jgi:hypothetical protein